MRCEIKQEDGGGLHCTALSCAELHHQMSQPGRRLAGRAGSLNLTVTSTEHITLPSLPCRVGTCQATQLTQKLLPVL